MERVELLEPTLARMTDPPRPRPEAFLPRDAAAEELEEAALGGA